MTLKPYRQPRGPGRKLDEDMARFVPFSGRAQRLPEDGPSAAVIDAARQRMVDIARRHQQESTRRQNFEALVQNERRARRGGTRGDVVGPGKRKAPEPDEPRSMLRRAEAMRYPAWQIVEQACGESDRETTTGVQGTSIDTI